MFYHARRVWNSSFPVTIFVIILLLNFTDGGLVYADHPKPQPPTSLAATGGNTQATLTWTAPTDVGGAFTITDYIVEFRLLPSGTFAVFADGTSGTTGATVTGLTNGESYEFRVFTVNSGGHTSINPSNVASAALPATAPSAITNLDATAGNAQATLTWSAPSNGGSAITDYIVEFKLTSSGSFSTFSDGTSATTGATVTGLTNGLSYDFRVSAVNAIGTGSTSNVDSATPVTVPSAVTDLDATAGNAQATLTWSAPSNGGSAITDYIVEFKLTSSGSFSTFSDGTSTATGATVTGLTNGLSYDFRVSAVNSVGTGSTSNVDSATPTPATTAPSAVTNLTATGGNTQATLTWSAPADGGSAITDYIVEFKLTSSGSFSTFSDGTSATTGATVTGLTNGLSYDFRVSAVNSVGTGPTSNVASTTPAVVPSAITNLDATAGNAQATLTWSAPSNGGSAITDYIVEFKLTSSGSFSTFSDGTSTATGATVTGLTNGLSYDFRVSAVNSVGTGSTSNVDSATPVTVPSAVTDLDATAGTSQATLIWSAPSNGGSAITDYVVEFRASGGSFTVFADGTSATTGATVTGLAGGTTYDFRVSAVNAIGTGPTSNVDSAAIPATVPSAITDLVAIAGTTQVALTWGGPPNGGSAITDYIVEFRLLPAGSFSTFTDGTSATTGATVTGLTNGLSYEFRVKAVNSVGTAPTSNVVSATPSQSPSITALVADDPNGGADTGFSAGDTITVRFSVPTNEPFRGISNSLTNTDINNLFTFSPLLPASSFTGTWLNPSTLVITTVTPDPAATIGGLTVTVLASANLKTDDETSAASTSTSPALSGSFGTFTATPHVNNPGDTVSSVLPSGVTLGVTSPLTGTVTIVRTTASNISVGNAIDFIGDVIDITPPTNSCSFSSGPGCNFIFTLTDDDLDAAGVTDFDNDGNRVDEIRIFHDKNGDGDFNDIVDLNGDGDITDPGEGSEILTTTVIPAISPGPYTVTATDFFTSKFAVGGIRALALGGASGDFSPPSFSSKAFSENEYPLTIDGTGYKLEKYSQTIPTITLETGKPIQMKILLYDPGGPSSIHHLAMYMNLRGSERDIQYSDTFIIYDKSVPTVISDPNGLFSKVIVTPTNVGNKLELTFDITFAKPMEKSDIIFRMWDDKRNNADTKVFDAIVVTGPEVQTGESILEETTPVQTIEPKQTNIPTWVKDNAGWWKDGQIADSEFVSGIQYLIQNDVMTIPETEESAYSSPQPIPSWIKNNAGWWRDGMISDSEFVTAIQWLVSNGIMKI